MNLASDLTFSNGDIVHVDDGRFVNCTFEQATLVYSGGGHPDFENCAFGTVGWRFEGPALKTIQLLQAIGSSPNGKFFIEDLFEPGKMLAGDLNQGITAMFIR